MIGVVIAAHGDLAQELLKTSEFILGPQEAMEAITVDPSQPVEKMQSIIKKAISRVDKGEGVLILTDMFGGTPANMTLSFLEDGKVEVITGVNLPMIIRVSQCRDGDDVDLKKAASSVVEYGRKSINQATRLLQA